MHEAFHPRATREYFLNVESEHGVIHAGIKPMISIVGLDCKRFSLPPNVRGELSEEYLLAPWPQ